MLLKDFIDWILGIDEDTPIPYEINHLYFFINGSNVCFGGNETYKNSIIDMEFFPLEAQYFYKSNQVLKDTNPLLVIKLLVLDSLENVEMEKLFAGKTIHIGYFGQESLFDLR